MTWKHFPRHASVTSHSRAPYGLFPGCFEHKSYLHSRDPHGTRAEPYEFCLPMRGPCGPRTAKYNARAGFLPIMVVSIPLRVRKGAVWHPCGSRKGPVGYKKMKIPVPPGPARCPHGHCTGYPWSPANYWTKPLVCSRVKPYGARSLEWQREQHRRKIPTGASLGLTGNKSYGW